MTLSTIDNAIVGFLDILGFRALVRAAGGRQEMAERLDRAILRALESFGGKESLRGTPDAEWSVRIFSDCLCVAKPATDLGLLVTLDAVSSFAREMIAAGFPIRGGMALGPYSESEVLIFSQAQVEAYDLESVHALYPRIILSSPLLGRVDEMEDDEIRRTAKELIIVDGDDIAFINYLIFEEEDSWFGGHRFYHEQKQALDGALLNRAFDFSTVSKYKWMARFHNWSLRQTAHILKKSGTLSEDDVWSFSSLIVKHPVGDGDFKSLLWADPTFERAIQQEGDLGVDWIKQWPGVMTDDDEDEGEGEDEGLI